MDYKRPYFHLKGNVRPVLDSDSAQLRHLSDLWLIPLETLLAFKKLHRQHFSSYMGAKRKALVRRFQYDVKNAAHLIRLLRMGAEFLATGRLQVFRENDAEELKRSKRGKAEDPVLERDDLVLVPESFF